MLVSPFVNPFPQPFAGPMPSINGQTITPGAQQLPPPPETLLPRVLNYYADYSGCGFWRMIWPEHVINAHQKLVVHGSTVMCFDPNYFRGIKAVRIQRQATEHQLRFVQFLKEISKEFNFRLIYEIDDLVFAEDIPEYNKFKPAFTDKKIRETAQQIMAMCDEITVTCDFMKEYYMHKTGNKNITVIPNYPPKFWMGHFYNEKRISENYDKYQKKPRVLYAGSGAHFDVDRRVNQNDDFAHVNRVIESTVDKYQWVFLGAFPLPLQHLVQSGKVEFHPWERLYTYPEKIWNLNVNAMVAPLQDNTFNKAKSDLKLIEASCYGIPIACQDLCTYENAPFKFHTGDEMIDQLDDILGKKGRYMNLSAKFRKLAENRWLENDDNIDKYVELYTLPYGSPQRKLLNPINKLPIA
jgi:hypothetical protein